METREIIKLGKAGTLRVPVDVPVDPYHGVRVGDRVAYCSVAYDQHLPFIAHMSRRDGWLEWLALAATGTVTHIVVNPAPAVDGPLTHEQFWATTAEVAWDNGSGDRYIKAALLVVEAADRPIRRTRAEVQ